MRKLFLTSLLVLTVYVELCAASYKEPLMKAIAYEEQENYKASTEHYKKAIFEIISRLNSKKIKLFSNVSLNMYPTIHKGDEIITVQTDAVQRGELIIFPYPKDEGVVYADRCVATEGDLLFIKDKNLYLYYKEGNAYTKGAFEGFTHVNIDGKVFVQNPYTSIHFDAKMKDDGAHPKQLFTLPLTQVPKGAFFALGDNADHSNDSRFFGSVKIKNLYKPMLVFNNDSDETRIGVALN